MKALLFTFLGILFFMFTSQALADQEHKIYQFNSQAKQTQFKKLTWELRCLVCQNQNLAESDAKLAADLRAQIAAQIKNGASGQNIINYMVKRYGDYILYKPPVMKSTWILWFGPFVLLVIGVLILYLTIFRQSKTNFEITDSEQTQIDELLNDMDKSS